jgi:AsmA protein
VLGVLIVGIVALAITVALLVDPNDYKDEIITAVKERTGRELKIEGDLELSFFPRLGLATGRIELANAPGFGERPFARVAAAGVRVEVLPLLRKELIVDTILLDGLELNLMKNKAGVSNWADLAAGETTAPKPAAPEAAAPAAPAIAALSIGGIRVSNGKILWLDQQAGQRYEIRALGLESGKIAPGEAVDLQMGFELDAGDPPRTVRVGLKSTLSMDLGEQTLTVSALNVSVDDLALLGNLKGSDILAKPKFTGEFEVPGFKPAVLLDLLGIALEPAQKNAFSKVSLKTRFSADLGRDTLELTDLALSADELSLSANLRAQQLQQAPRASGRIDIAPFDLRKLMSKLGVDYPTADKRALTKVALKTRFSASNTQLALSKLEATLDQSRLTGALTVRNFAKPAYGFNLALNEIDLDRYLPRPAPPAKSAVPQGAGGSAAAPVAIPLEALRALDLQGRLRIDTLKAFGIRSAQVRIKLAAKGGLITVGPNQAKLYGGGYAGSTVIDARAKVPKFRMKDSLERIALGPFLTDAGITEQFAGTGNLSTDLRARGLDAEAITRTLSGTLALSLKDGEIKGVDLQKMVNDAVTFAEKAKGQAPTIKPKPTDSTRFDSFSASFKISNGLARNDDLRLQGPFLLANKKKGGLWASGKGTADLARQTIDYRLLVKVAEEAARRGTTIPIDIRGSFAEPQFKPDWNALVKAEVKKKIETRKQEKKQDLEDKLKKKLKEKFKF